MQRVSGREGEGGEREKKRRRWRKCEDEAAEEEEVEAFESDGRLVLSLFGRRRIGALRSNQLSKGISSRVSLARFASGGEVVVSPAYLRLLHENYDETMRALPRVVLRQTRYRRKYLLLGEGG